MLKKHLQTLMKCKIIKIYVYKHETASAQGSIYEFTFRSEAIKPAVLKRNINTTMQVFIV